MPAVADLLQVLGGTLRDVLPLAAILALFQLLVLRRPLANPRRLLLGFAYVLVGLVLFLMGLEQAIFPVGKTMAAQLTAPDFLAAGGDGAQATIDSRAYVWVFVFGFAIGFSTTMAEPALIAVALKARELSAGAIDPLGLRIAVALGVAIGVSLGLYRIVVGAPLHYFIMAGYVVVVVQTLFAPKLIVPLAYDSGSQPAHRWLRPHRLRQSLSNDHRDGVCPGQRMARCAQPFARRSGGRGSGSIRGESNMRFKLLVVFVDDHMTEAVTQAAREAGATGCTVVTNARGEGLEKKKTFLGLNLEIHRDMLLLLVEEHRARHVLETVGTVGEFDTSSGTGIAFQVDVEDAVGVAHQVQSITPSLEGEEL
jgi:hypothetical protein